MKFKITLLGCNVVKTQAHCIFIGNLFGKLGEWILPLDCTSIFPPHTTWSYTINHKNYKSSFSKWVTHYECTYFHTKPQIPWLEHWYLTQIWWKVGFLVKSMVLENLIHSMLQSFRYSHRLRLWFEDNHFYILCYFPATSPWVSI